MLRWRVGTGLRIVLLLAAVVCGTVRTARAQNVYFSDLSWNDTGTRLRLLAGNGDELRTLEVEPSTGFVRCLDPVVHDPVWSEARGRVLFRDRFGVFEIEPHSSIATAQLVFFLPESAPHFVRAYGSDTRGRLLIWTYDRVRGEHAIWTQRGDAFEPVPGTLNGAEALRLWEERNRARRFERVGGRFVRSYCVRRPGTDARLCLENVAGRFRGRSPFFRVTMGAPGGVEVLQNRCAPSGVSASPDTSLVVVGLYEELDDNGRSEVQSVWVTDWENGTRVYETLLPAVVDVRARHDTWALWRPGGSLLWVDAAGQLLQVEARAPDANVLVPLQMPSVRAPLYRVVALTVTDVATAQPYLEQLGQSGLDSGLYDARTHFEIQVGAATTRAHARARADDLRRQGFTEAREIEGGVDELATGMGFGWVPSAEGRGAFLRHVSIANGVQSELWYVDGPGETPRLLVPTFASLVPQGTEP